MTDEAAALTPPGSPPERFGDAIGRSPEMQRVFSLLSRVATTDSTILLTGESGTGKEVLAEAIHRRSRRAKGPFIVFDCGAVVPGLIESELFGHEAGAFTNAVRARPGLLAEASGGTLLLDEIGELPLALQPKLLRVIAKGEVRRVGASAATRVDVRVIAATHRNLEQAVAAGRFRADLYFRLAVVVVRVPPLRLRPEDVPVLARHFIAHMASEEQARAVLTPSVNAALVAHDWPGNVRELRNVVERLLAVGDLAGALARDVPADFENYYVAKRDAIERFERAFVRVSLDACGGVVTRAARRAGISRQMFHRLMSRHGIESRD
ncbi:MAG TPA: sigma-54 dependent transcriptional regulator [Kofleriaceae bacterium]|nr:sigma-54 dependent transcriptional regulator [Kofleriaceae bacterium]